MDWVNSFFSDLTNKLSSDKTVKVSGIFAGTRGLFLVLLANKLNSPLLVISDTEDEVVKLDEDINALSKLLNLPVHTIVLPEEGNNQRLKCLYDIVKREQSLILSTPKALEKPTFSKPDFVNCITEYRVEQAVNYKQLLENFAHNNYSRVDYVEQPGEYSVRGEVVDIWSAQYSSPARIVLDGETIETINFFDPDTQRSKEVVLEIQIIPAKEVGESQFTDFIDKDTVVYFEESEAEASHYILEGKFRTIVEAISTGTDTLNFNSLPVPNFQSKLNSVWDSVNQWQQDNYTIYFYATNAPEQDHLSELLETQKVLKKFPEIVIGPLNAGFVHPNMQLAIITENDIYNRAKIRYRLPKFRIGRTLESLQEISVGDYVVHENYGIGIYRGIEHLKLSGNYTDFLHIEYRHGDILHVPITDFRLIQKYIGPEGYKPRVYSLDGTSWERIKQKVKQSAQDMTRELVQLYAAREAVSGFAFPDDSYIEKEFAISFPYEETPDQAKAITDVKKDMTSPKPMDRIIIGDVGYGKTEVAIRAALKCVLTGKQVVMLVPTTILAEQHYETFKTRLESYPVKVEMLSRFRSKIEQKTILEDLKSGTVDIIIGTHRLLSQDITIPNLGLLVIDEEHRFGVRAKEKIKQLRTNIDVLTLSATPIPRTLAMGLSGVREISIISTPPEGRLPINTYVDQYDETLVRDAIHFEISRGGQVFYVHNRVETICTVISRLQTLLPQITFGVAHGQMSASTLETIMHKFVTGQVQVLVSTTIIESGLDLPRVNTLIIEKAEDLGLAQLYQIRGRVGRSKEKAYCYIFYTPGTLTETAVKRLKAIQEFTNLGSGLHLSLRDLEIRGAGNILGSQQHGFIGEIGYDMYFRILSEEIKEVKGTAKEEDVEPVLDFPVEAYLPEEYIPTSAIRILFYKRILSANTDTDLNDIQKEVQDRFGKMPEPVETLFKLAELRVLAKQLKIIELKMFNNKLILTFSKQSNTDPQKIICLSKEYPQNMVFSNPNPSPEKETEQFRVEFSKIPENEDIFIFLKKLLSRLT